MSKNEYAFREADRSDFPKITFFFNNLNYGLKEEKWLEWKYLKNPFGQGRIFLMEDSNNHIKGTLGYIPRVIINRETGPLRVMESVDLFFAPEARGKRLFPKIQRFAMNLINTPLIAFPNKRSERITLQLGWQTLAPLESWYLPIEWVRHPPKHTSKYLHSLIGLLGRIYAAFCLIGDSKNSKIKPVNKFRHEFNKKSNRTWFRHSLNYLNWRFIDNPTREYTAFEFYENEDLTGYCVLGVQGSSAMIYDFFAPRNTRACMQKLLKHCQETRIRSLHFRGVGLHLWRFGFIRLFTTINLVSFNLPKKSWILTLSDSDW